MLLPMFPAGCVCPGLNRHHRWKGIAKAEADAEGSQVIARPCSSRDFRIPSLKSHSQKVGRGPLSQNCDFASSPKGALLKQIVKIKHPQKRKRVSSLMKNCMYFPWRCPKNRVSRTLMVRASAFDRSRKTVADLGETDVILVNTCRKAIEALRAPGRGH